MKKHFIIYLVLAAVSFLLQSCLDRDPVQEARALEEKYNNKEITNARMLFEMGRIYRENPDNEKVRTGYFEKMIISGYASHILHLYLEKPEKQLAEEDMKMILFALQKGNHFDLAEKFAGRFSETYRERLKNLSAVNDSLRYYNTLVKNNRDADAYEERGSYFRRINAQEMANFDFDNAVRLDPCNPGALFEKAVLLFKDEKTAEVAGLLEKCSNSFEPGQPAWYPVFLKLANDLQDLQNSSLTEKELLFRQANLYVNSGFPEMALRKSGSLLKTDGNSNPDYLALHGFIYYKMKNKEQAMKYVSEAERISGRKSKLSELIAQLD